MTYRTVEKPFPKGGWKIKRDSLSKMKVYMTPHSKPITRYSLDWQTNRKRDPLSQNLGLQRLEKHLFSHFPGYHHALIYDMDSDEKIREYNSQRHRIE